jgi:hypothetical protein
VNVNQTELAIKKPSSSVLSNRFSLSFAQACRAHDAPVVIMQQDGFAADYQEEEYIASLA